MGEHMRAIFQQADEAHLRKGAGRPNAATFYKNAAHVTSWDASEANVKDVRDFLRAIDARK